MKKQTTLNFIVLCLGIALSVSNTRAQYNKKVVSFVDHVVTSSSSGLTGRQASYIAAVFSKSVKMDRFNYATLPENIVKTFVAQSVGMSTTDAERVRAAIEQTLAPKFLELLDLNKEMLSKQNLTEAERNSFLATKAQSAGLSASQLEAILNSGFFYVPYVEYFHHGVERGEREVKNDQGKVVRKVPTINHTLALKAGLLWFQLSVDRSNNATVRFIGAANGWKGRAIDRSETRDLENSEGLEWEIFTDIVNISGVNVGNETKKLEEFRLSGTVSETTLFGVMLNLGSREGVGLDDSYWIEELEENEAGEIQRNRRGFVKIREVGNNTTDASATSYAQTITGSNYSPGLSVKEIPMIGLNALVGLGSIPVMVSPFDNRTAVGTRPANFGLTKHDFAVNVTGETKSAFGPFVWIQGSMANSTKISELWFHAGAALGFLSLEGKFYVPTYNVLGIQNGIDSSSDIGVSLTGYANFGLVKKFYFRRFGLVLQADVKYWLTELSATGKDDNGDDLNYSLSNDALGFDGKAGIEVYINPALSIGAGAEYNIFATDNIWTAMVTDKDKNETKNSDAVGPDTKYSGLGVYVWVNYALPSLF